MSSKSKERATIRQSQLNRNTTRFVNKSGSKIKVKVELKDTSGKIDDTSLDLLISPNIDMAIFNSPTQYIYQITFE